MIVAGAARADDEPHARTDDHRDTKRSGDRAHRAARSDRDSTDRDRTPPIADHQQADIDRAGAERPDKRNDDRARRSDRDGTRAPTDRVRPRQSDLDRAGAERPDKRNDARHRVARSDRDGTRAQTDRPAPIADHPDVDRAGAERPDKRNGEARSDRDGTRAQTDRPPSMADHP